jgi:hypothetical protein
MKDVKYFIPFVLLTAILCFQLLNYCSDRAMKHTNSIDTVYVKSNDTWHNVPFKVEVPVPYKVEVPGPGAASTITVPAVIDSLAVVLDYYSKRYYADSIKNDSIEIRLNYACYKNQVQDMKLAYRWIAKQMIIRETNVVERQLAFIGLDIYGNTTHLGVIPSIYFDTRRGMYGGGYDPFNKYVKVGAYFKGRLWKRRITK